MSAPIIPIHHFVEGQWMKQAKNGTQIRGQRDKISIQRVMIIYIDNINESS